MAGVLQILISRPDAALALLRCSSMCATPAGTFWPQYFLSSLLERPPQGFATSLASVAHRRGIAFRMYSLHAGKGRVLGPHDRSFPELLRHDQEVLFCNTLLRCLDCFYEAAKCAIAVAGTSAQGFLDAWITRHVHRENVSDPFYTAWPARTSHFSYHTQLCTPTSPMGTGVYLEPAPGLCTEHAKCPGIEQLS